MRTLLFLGDSITDAYRAKDEFQDRFIGHGFPFLQALI